MKKSRKRRIKSAFKGKYILIFLGVFLTYVGLNVYFNELYVTLGTLTNLNQYFVWPFLFFNFLLVPFLIALTMNLSILRFKEAGSGFDRKSSSRASGIGGIGAISGIIAGACPGCFVGLFPAFLGLFGISATLSSLPLFGLELQALSAGLLTFAIFLLTKDIVCEVPIANPKEK